MQSEQGFLGLAGREAPLAPREALLAFRDLLSADMDWADHRKRRNRRNASRVRIVVLGLTALSTIVLGITVIPERASIALPMVASVTVLGGLEAYYNWRGIWVLMEETQYRLNRVRDYLDFYLVTTPADRVTTDKLREFFVEQQEIWNDVSQRWIAFRKLEQTPRENDPVAGPDHR